MKTKATTRVRSRKARPRPAIAKGWQVFEIVRGRESLLHEFIDYKNAKRCMASYASDSDQTGIVAQMRRVKVVPA